MDPFRKNDDGKDAFQLLIENNEPDDEAVKIAGMWVNIALSKGNIESLKDLLNSCDEKWLPVIMKLYGCKSEDDYGLFFLRMCSPTILEKWIEWDSMKGHIHKFIKDVQNNMYDEANGSHEEKDSSIN